MKKEIDKKELGANRYIGQKIYEARVAAGLTLGFLAKKINVSKQQLMKYENGTDTIKIAKLFLLAEELSLGLSYFLGDINYTEWDKKTSEPQKAALNISNNFMKIKDTACRKAVSALLAAISQLDSDINTRSC